MGLHGVGEEAEQQRHRDGDEVVVLDGVGAPEAGRRRWTEEGRRCGIFLTFQRIACEAARLRNSRPDPRGGEEPPRGNHRVRVDLPRPMGSQIAK